MRIIGLSDANILGIHSMALIAASGECGISVHSIAEITKCSQHHLTKVVDTLSKSGLIYATRGPSGGFHLGRSADEISLLEIYEAISGEIDQNDLCLSHSNSKIQLDFFKNVCNELSEEFLKYLKLTKLSDIQTKAEKILNKK
ncbi:MAG TPA: Rrf2 family transcriptional regulator [Bacteroidales bacterium]|nr:Rrf2 family transcriptional regulator [Bacteroidales bacterium]